MNATRKIVASRMTPALAHRAALIVNHYLRVLPSRDFPAPMKAERVVMKVRMSNPDLRALMESFAELATAVQAFK